MWSLYDEQGTFLPPIQFSNGKTQQDVVNEVLAALQRGEKIIFIRGGCGTGKSAIALNIAKEIGRASIIVPVKGLQKQYEEDYANKKYLLKKDGGRLKIKVLTGRANHECRYLKEEGQQPFLAEKKESNSKLSDFTFLVNQLIAKVNENNASEAPQDTSADNLYLPCKIEITERNRNRIQDYLKQNPRINASDFHSIYNVRRMSIAPVCPYWSPVAPAEVELNLDADIKKYQGLSGKEFKFYQRKEGCSYYGQFASYLNADVLIFNSQKYKLEVAMNRKPLTDVEIIDECDEFLDSFANTEKINLHKLELALGYLFSENEEVQKKIGEITRLLKSVMTDFSMYESMMKGDIKPLKETKLFPLLRELLDSKIMQQVECDEENYCYDCEEVAMLFRAFFDETYVSFVREGKDIAVSLITTNLEKRFQELLDKNKALVLMSGTLHSEAVLRDVFGLQHFTVIDAETKFPGNITLQPTGLEFNCTYDVLKLPETRKKYLHALEACIREAEKPLLIHVTAFKDLPSEEEHRDLHLLMKTSKHLLEIQRNDRTGNDILSFKQGKFPVLYSTRCNRGIDFPGNICNSIILTRFPYPDINSLFWKILKKTKPEYYDEFYRDKARREFLQRIYRGLRSRTDHIFLLSPDKRVLQAGHSLIEHGMENST